jgi:hypothetical protein
MIPGIVVNALYIDLLPSQTGSKAWQILCFLSFLSKVIMARYRVVSSVPAAHCNAVFNGLAYSSCLVAFVSPRGSFLKTSHFASDSCHYITTCPTPSQLPHTFPLQTKAWKSICSPKPSVPSTDCEKTPALRIPSTRTWDKVSTITTTSYKTRPLSRQLATKAGNTMEQDFNKQVYTRDAISRGLCSPSANENLGKGVKRRRMK